jgi:hypothetical protein
MQITTNPENAGFTKDQTRKIEITQADASFKINNGIVSLQAINATNNIADIKGFGSINLNNKNLNLPIDISARFANFSAQLPILINGTYDNVKFSPRLNDIIANKADKIKDISKINLKNIKIKIDKNDLKGSFKELLNNLNQK